MATNPFAGLTHDAISNQFLSETGRITNKIWYQQRRCIDTFWKDFFPMAGYPLGEGTNPSYPVFQENVPSGDSTMTAIGLSNCATDQQPCDPGFEYVANLGITLKPMTVYQSPIYRTTDVCVTDLAFDWNAAMQMDMKVTNLVFQTKWRWARLGLKNFLTGPVTKLVVAPYSDGSLPVTNNNTALPTTQAVYPMSTGVLIQQYRQFLDLGLGCNNNGDINGTMPMYDLWGDPQDLLNMWRGDPAFRQDTRWSSSADGLLGGIPSLQRAGELAKAMGYNLHSLIYPPRFTYAGGVYTEVLPFSTGIPTTVNSAQTTLAAYQAAPYSAMLAVGDRKESFVWRIPNFTTRFGKATFGNHPYNGQFDWLNYPTDQNPMQKKGYFASQIITGWDFPFPNYSALIFYKRCFTPTATVQCSPDGAPSCTPNVFGAAPEAVNPTAYSDPCILP